MLLLAQRNPPSEEPKQAAPAAPAPTIIKMDDNSNKDKDKKKSKTSKLAPRDTLGSLEQEELLR